MKKISFILSATLALFLVGCSYSAKAPSAVQPSAPSSTESYSFTTCPGNFQAQLDAATKAAAAEGYEPVPFVKVSEGGYLVDSNGMTLYTFKKDEACKSNCEGTCLVNWPPLQPNGNFLIGDKTMKGTLGYITGANGKSHITYNSKPLYFWVNDKKPGDTSGDGVNGVWFLAKP